MLRRPAGKYSSSHPQNSRLRDRRTVHCGCHFRRAPKRQPRGNPHLYTFAPMLECVFDRVRPGEENHRLGSGACIRVIRPSWRRLIENTSLRQHKGGPEKRRSVTNPTCKESSSRPPEDIPRCLEARSDIRDSNPCPRDWSDVPQMDGLAFPDAERVCRSEARSYRDHITRGRSELDRRQRTSSRIRPTRGRSWRRSDIYIHTARHAPYRHWRKAPGTGMWGRTMCQSRWTVAVAL